MDVLRRARRNHFLVEAGACAVLPGGAALAVTGDACPCDQLPAGGCPIAAHLEGDGQGHVMYLDHEHRITYLNRPSPGRTVDEVIGLRIYEALPGDTFERGTIQAFLCLREPGELRVEATRGSDGHRSTWVLRGEPMPRGCWVLRLAMVERKTTSSSGVHWSAVPAPPG